LSPIKPGGRPALHDANTLSAPKDRMKKPITIQFLGMGPSPALEEAALRKIDKLELFCSDIVSCRTTIELLKLHDGRSVAVRIDVTLPGHELTVSRVHHDDAQVALRNAFNGMARQIEDVMSLSRQVRRSSLSLDDFLLGERSMIGSTD